jgi:hypothetical protein
VNAGGIVLLMFSMMSYGAFYSTTDFGRLSEGVETRPAQELFDFVRNHTQPDEACLFFKPRALALYTGRRSSAYPLGTDEQEFWKYATAVGAKLIIVREGAADLRFEDQTYEMGILWPPSQLRKCSRIQCSTFIVGLCRLGIAVTNPPNERLYSHNPPFGRHAAGISLRRYEVPRLADGAIQSGLCEIGAAYSVVLIPWKLNWIGPA